MRTSPALVASLALTACQAAAPVPPPRVLPPAPVLRPEPARPRWTWAAVERPEATRDESEARCPAEMTLVGRQVCVDRFEAHLVAVGADGSERPWSPDRAPTVRVQARAAEGTRPQAFVDGGTAAAACAEAGKRLCTSREWIVACRGPADTRYPYGNERVEGACNGDGRASHPVGEVTQRYGLPPDRMWYENMQDARINQLPDTVEPSGRHRACTNAFGAFDMVGNVHEWVDDPSGTFRGGFYMDTRINGEGCEYATTAHGNDYRDYSTGFRCCRDPEPG